MDPRTTFVIATLMMLLNGGVLGLMHRDLPSEVQPSAFSWRVGTLLLAGGCILLAVQDQLPLGFILPVANGCLFLGITGYWRALRQFYGFKDSPALLLPVVIASVGIYWFSAIAPSLEIRVVLASAVWTLITFACVWTLRAGNAADSAVSRSVLAGIFLVIGSFMFLRGIYFAANGDGIQNVLDARSWLSAVTPLVAAVLPVIGTTAFLLLCSERIRRHWEHAAATDYLTDLPNRRTLTESGEQRFALARSQNSGLTVVVIDIDHFKNINDRYGHDTGDRALIHVAKVLRSACPATAQLARQGGEEFVVLFDTALPADAIAAAERLRLALHSTPLALPLGPLTITASFGVSVLGSEDRRFDDTLRRADQAVYAAKSAGRNRVELDV